MRQLFDFDEIRPFYDEEIPDIIRSLTKEEKFRHALKFVVPDVDAFCRQMEECTTKREFQKRLAIPVLNDLALLQEWMRADLKICLRQVIIPICQIIGI